MIVGDRTSFAIESGITKAFPTISQRALGFFVIHIRGRVFGVQEPEASMLSCSFDGVNNRLLRRGTHSIPGLVEVDAYLIAEAYLDVFYRETPRGNNFGLSRDEFAEALCKSEVTWAPDGDEAFDDGSYVLQFDIGRKVRIVSFVGPNSPADAVGTVTEEWLDADVFYDVLSRWSDLFISEWVSKVDEEEALEQRR